MMISTKGRYALRAMVDIAQQNTGEFITLKDIARRQEISEKYLESILPILTKAGLLYGVRGKGGGYKLTRPPESYTVGSILSLVEGSFIPVSCLENSPVICHRAPDCCTLPMWQHLKDTVETFFEGYTVADLCNQKRDNSDFVI